MARLVMYSADSHCVYKHDVTSIYDSRRSYCGEAYLLSDCFCFTFDYTSWHNAG